MTNNINEAINNLEESVMFNLSLSSKELFHSNFLYWLIKDKLYNKEIGRLFSDFLKLEVNDYTVTSPEREKHNIDLSFEIGNNLIIIENKVKSIPSEKQLDDYTKKINDNKDYKEKQKHFILLSLSKPLFFNDSKYSWKYLSYAEYSQLLSKINIENDNSKYLKDYIDFIKNLVTLNDEIEVDKDKIFFDDETILKLFKEIRLHDLYHKRKYSMLLNLLDSELDSEIKNTDCFKNFEKKLYYVPGKENKYESNIIYLNSGLSGRGKKGLMEFKLKISDEIVMGVQIEGNEYRQFIHANEIKKDYKVMENKANDFLSNPDDDLRWFQFKHFKNENKDILPNKENNRIKCDNFFSYNPDFFYRKVILDNNIKTNKIIDNIILDIKEVIKIYNKLNK